MDEALGNCGSAVASIEKGIQTVMYFLDTARHGYVIVPFHYSQIETKLLCAAPATLDKLQLRQFYDQGW